MVKHFRTNLFITILLLLFFISCNKDGTRPCQRGGYSFAVTAEWSPQQDIYHIGDTIYLTSTFPKILTDQINTSIIVDYSNSVGIQGDLGIGYLDSITHQPKAARNSFTIFSIKGNFSERPGSQEWGLNFNYTETPNNYEFKAAFVCKKKGVYGMSVDNLISKGLRGDDCTNAGFTMTVTNSEKHLYLHHNALNIDTTDLELQQKGYDFRVQ